MGKWAKQNWGPGRPYGRRNVADVPDVRAQLVAMRVQEDMRVCQREDHMWTIWPMLTQRCMLL